MRLAALIILCLLVIAASAIRIEPVRPDPRLPTFSEMNDRSRARPTRGFEPTQSDPRLSTFSERNDSSRRH